MSYMRKLEFFTREPEQAFLPDTITNQVVSCLKDKSSLTKTLQNRIGFGSSQDLLTYTQLLDSTTLAWYELHRISSTYAPHISGRIVDASTLALLYWGEKTVELDAFNTLRQVKPLDIPETEVQEIRSAKTAEDAFEKALSTVSKATVRQTATTTSLGAMYKTMRAETLSAQEHHRRVNEREQDYHALAALFPSTIVDEQIESVYKQKEKEYRENGGVKQAVWNQLLAEGHPETRKLDATIRSFYETFEKIEVDAPKYMVLRDTYGQFSPGGELFDEYEIALSVVRDKRRQSGKNLEGISTFDLLLLANQGNWRNVVKIASNIAHIDDNLSMRTDFRMKLLVERRIISPEDLEEINKVEAFQEIAWKAQSIEEIAQQGLFAEPGEKESVMARHLLPYLEKGIGADFLFSILKEGLSGRFMDEIIAAYVSYDLPGGEKQSSNKHLLAKTAVGAAILITLALLLRQCQNTQPPVEPTSTNTPTMTPTPTPTQTPTPQFSVATNIARSPLSTYASPTPTPTPTNTSTPTATPTSISVLSQTEVVEITSTAVGTPVAPEVVSTQSPTPTIEPGPAPEEPLDAIKEKQDAVRRWIEETKREIDSHDFNAELRDAIEKIVEAAKELQKKPEIKLAELEMLAIITLVIRRNVKGSYAKELFNVTNGLFDPSDPARDEFLGLMSWVSERPRGLDLSGDYWRLQLMPVFWPFYWIESGLESISTIKFRRGIDRYKARARQEGGKWQDLMRQDWEKTKRLPTDFLSQYFGFDKTDVEKKHLYMNLQAQLLSITDQTLQNIQAIEPDPILQKQAIRNVLNPFRLASFPPRGKDEDAFSKVFVSKNEYMEAVRYAFFYTYDSELKKRSTRWYRHNRNQPIRHLKETPDNYALRMVDTIPGIELIGSCFELSQSVGFWTDTVLRYSKPQTVLLGWDEPKNDAELIPRKDHLQRITRT